MICLPLDLDCYRIEYSAHSLRGGTGYPWSADAAWKFLRHDQLLESYSILGGAAHADLLGAVQNSLHKRSLPRTTLSMYDGSNRQISDGVLITVNQI